MAIVALIFRRKVIALTDTANHHWACHCPIYLSLTGHRLSCGHAAGCKRSLRCADPGEYHEVRCCSDAPIEGWRQPDTACPYIESETFTKMK